MKKHLFTAILILLVAGFTQAQPVVYADNAGGRLPEGELFPGALLYQLERRDWLPLTHLAPDMGTYRIRLTNAAQEVLRIHEVALAVVDHPENTEVLFDKTGALHTLQLIQRPRMAVDRLGRDVQRLVADPDGKAFYANFDERSADAEEALVLEFRRTHGILEAKVVLDAKNTPWLEDAFAAYLEQFGTSVGQPLSKSSDKFQQWMLQQNVPVKVWLETGPGSWQLQGWFNLAGTQTTRRQVMMIDIASVPAETVRIKLSYGFMFWEIDRVGMDFSTDIPVLQQPVKPLKAVDAQGADVLQPLLADDILPLQLNKPGEMVTAVFQAPKQHPGLKRSIFLYGKGYYETLRPAPKTKPDFDVMAVFDEPGGFTRFSQERWYRFLKSKKVTPPQQ